MSQIDSIHTCRDGHVVVVLVAGEYALLAAKPIRAGETLFVIEGEARDLPSRHSLQMGENLHIDIGPDRSPEEILDRCYWQFLKHSCDPNTVVRGRAVIALRPIHPWDELTFNYNTTEFNIEEPFECRCGAPLCTGQIQGFKHLPTAQRERLRPFLADHLKHHLEPNPISTPHPGVDLMAGVETPSVLHEFFDRAARRWPERVAIEVPSGNGHPRRRTITYAELRRQSDALAHLLSPFIGDESVVAIMAIRNSECLYVSQLAVLKTGAAYTCVDPAFPDEQVRDILQDSQPVALLTDAAGWARASDADFAVPRMFNIAECIERVRGLADPPPLESRVRPTSLAYIIYTSGTTGRPKGVMIEHRSIANLVSADLEEFGLTPEDRVAQSSSAAYDSSLEELWLALAAGATVVVLDDEAARLGPDLIRWLRDERITVLCPSPTLLRTMGCDDPMKALPDLHFVYVGGEALPQDVADRWSRGRHLVNGYGPTECTVTSLRGSIHEGKPISIGLPVRGIQAWVLNEALEVCPDGQKGELCLGGVALARGYRNQPELTAQKFPVHTTMGRIYRTGDLVHRCPEGNFYYHGRIDSQVKLRGYRIELEAIESRLAECAGVREAACRIQGEGTSQVLVGFVVPEAMEAPLSLDDLKASLQKVLPTYMVPSHLGILQQLPKSVGGKLNRRALPLFEMKGLGENRHSMVPPRNTMEGRIASAISRVFERNDPISVEDDFFFDLGGDSLRAAMLVSLLRDHHETASITVRDIYESRTVAELATRAHASVETAVAVEEETVQRRKLPVLATFLQTLWLLLGLMAISLLAYFGSFRVLPFVMGKVGLVPFIFLVPVLVGVALGVYTPASVLLAVVIKRVLIGRYRQVRAPVWGSFYVRNWMVEQVVRIIPWRLIGGTVFQNAALRALGARIGRRVHLHRGVDLLQGGWDLLEIGDDVTVSQDASIRLVEIDDGHVTVGAVTLKSGSTLDVRAGVGPNTCLEQESYLTSLSSLPPNGQIPRGERWDGIPAMPAGKSPPRPLLSEGERLLSPAMHGFTLILSRFALALVVTLPIQLIAIAFALFHKVEAEQALAWLDNPSLGLKLFFAGIVIATLAVPFTVALEALVLRAMGRIPEGVISRWSLTYIKVWLKTGLVQSASAWLSGTLFWPVWLRWAGMKVGKGCEISTIIDVIPELIEIESESFFADGIYLGGPRVYRGTVTLAPVRLGKNVFLGNHVVIAGGQRLPNDVLLGVCTISNDTTFASGSSWFGHPPFTLPRREIIECDRRFTYDPSWIRYWNRVFWELLRFAIPIAPMFVLPLWFTLAGAAEATIPRPIFFVGMLPLVTLGTISFFCLLVLGLKWMLLGRVRPGQHPLWSCWCSRWDFLYVAWAIYARGVLSTLEGTLLLSFYLRAMGARIGRRVVLGSGFAQVVDPDMLHLEDEATVDCQFQAHTFEDRVLKIDRIRIRRRANVGRSVVLLYGADIAERTRVAPHSVVMKRERLLAGRSYAGCPTRPV